MRRTIIMGAAGRDFHDFNTVFRDSDTHRVVAFTATQIPGIDGRVYPASLAGPLHPDGIPIRPQEELEQLVADLDVDEVVLSYSDLSHTEVMHQASRVLATGADFRLLGPGTTMLPSPRPVVAVTAARTGAGKSQTSRYIGQLLLEQGLRVAQVRHPMPYGNLEAMRVQRFATLEDIDASNPTIEEREEYEAPVRMGLLLYAGVDYGDILEQATAEADVIVEDGPTITHGGMPYGAGTVAARHAGVHHIIDPRPHAVGSIADTYRAYPDIGHVLPAMGYGDHQTRDLEATIRASGCDVVISGTPIDLSRLVDVGCPIRRAAYTLQEHGARHLRDALAPPVRTWLGAGRP